MERHGCSRLQGGIPAKSCPATCRAGAKAERRYSSYSFLTSALDGGERSALRPGRDLPPREGPRYPLDTRLILLIKAHFNIFLPRILHAIIVFRYCFLQKKIRPNYCGIYQKILRIIQIVTCSLYSLHDVGTYTKIMTPVRKFSLQIHSRNVDAIWYCRIN
jgi:hypothetical protein